MCNAILRTKRRKWRGDIQISTGNKVFVYMGVCPGSNSASAAGKRSYLHGCTSATSPTVHLEISPVSESQQPRKLILLVNVWATRKDRVHHYEGKMLEFSEWKEWNEWC